MTMWLWMMVCRERVRRQFEHAERPWSVWRYQETQGSRDTFFRFCSAGVALLSSTRTWTCMSWIPLHQRFRVARPPLTFRLNGQDVSAFTDDNRDLCRQTGKAENIYAIRGRWSKRRWRTNPCHLFSILRCDVACPRFQAHRSCGMGGHEMHVASESASVDGGVVRRWLQHSGRRTLLHARIRLVMTSMLLRRRWYNSDRWHSQPRRSFHLQVRQDMDSKHR